jgi:hypothetical protein
MHRRGCAGLVTTLQLVAILANMSGAVDAQGHDDRLGQRREGSISFEPKGPGVFFDALDPTVKRWYVPQELYNDYGFKTWEYSNYARDPYQRYVNTNLEGEHFYDMYGSHISRGWLIYDWRQEALTPLGSSVFQDSRYQGWFNQVLIASDAKGGTRYSITVGDQIRTTLTPLTFSKPAYNGIQLDASTDKYQGTLLLSRVSGPVRSAISSPDTRTNATNMVGGRALAQVGDFVTIGATYLNTHTTRTTLGSFEGNPVHGTLGDGQARVPVTAIALILSDDSPEDGEGGAALFAHDIAIIREDFQTGIRHRLTLADLTNDPTRWPIIEGGFQEGGFLAANGSQRIIINYDFTDPSYIGPDPTEIVDVTFDLVVANDYRIDVWSDRQTGQSAPPAAPLTGEVLDERNPALLELARAPANVKDGSNRRRLLLDYGLPTANQIIGFTAEGTDILGFDFYGEYDINHRFNQYPNLALFTDDRPFEVSSESADAWMMNLSWQGYPWFFFGEAFSMDHDYSTSSYLVNSAGDVSYDQPGQSLYEFVDDNDDQDRLPDWQRANQSGPDFAVFPGWDENNDFVSDFNQNDTRSIGNRIPDYDEPFLRYDVDRPEFLYGIDLNNNDWIDRFENDDEPDYPYKRDHQGYNVYGGVRPLPGVRLSIGQTREELQSSGRRNHTSYAMAMVDQDYAGFGRLRAFHMLKLAKDRIPDDRREAQPFLDSGPPALVVDVLPAQDTWINSLYLGFDYNAVPNLNVRNKLKLDFYVQRQDDLRTVDRRLLDDRASFFGLINKVDYTIHLDRMSIAPRFKSQFLRRAPFVKGVVDTREWDGLLSAIVRFPVLNRSAVEIGAELHRLAELNLDEDQHLEDSILGPTGDRTETTLALQWTTSSAYLGYKLLIQTGFRLSRTADEEIRIRDLKVRKGSDASTGTTTFITVYAGVDQ